MRLARARPLIASVKYSNVPESVPGAEELERHVRESRADVFQLSTFEPGSQIYLSSATERHVAQVFCLLTTTVSASFATVNAFHGTTLLSWHDFASAIRIGRDASEMSVSPWQNR